jgi:thiamine kinase-like enzyme
MSDAAHDLIRSLPCFKGAINVEALAGGMTNRNFLVVDQQRERFVARLGRDLPEHGILRFHELAAARAAFDAGVSPEVIYASAGCMVSRYIAGRTLTPADVADADNLNRIVSLLQRCHRDIPRHFRGPALIFWVFQVIRGYLAMIGQTDGNPLDLPLTRLRQQAERLEKAQGPSNIVFGHNDLLAANFIDDGARLWLIDWDYAGFNTPLFDLANLSSNNALTSDRDARLLECYFQGPSAATLLRAFSAMKCASLLREALWGAVSLIKSSIPFDFGSYARDYMKRFEIEWQRFEQDHG